MDAVEMLDILGNENRRRILQLLSFRPFYFNEMAKRLDLGPKAVINHLEMLERAGLIECYNDNRRRKYFRIAENLVLEVAVSPHTYGVRTHRPEGFQEDFGLSQEREAPRDASLDHAQATSGEIEHLRALRSRLVDLEEKRRHLRRLLDEVESEEMAIKKLAIDLIQYCAEDLLEAEILIALTSGRSRAESLANRLRVPTAVVEERLQMLEALGKVRKRGDEWTI